MEAGAEPLWCPPSLYTVVWWMVAPGLVLISLAELEHFLRVSCSEMMDAAMLTTVDLSTGLREI